MSSLTAADFDPTAELLLTEGRERRYARLGGRERLTRWLFAVAFLLVAAPLMLLAPTTPDTSFLLVVALIGAFAISARIEFEVGAGGGVPTQLIFVPMLFVLPAGDVPIAVAVGMVASHIDEFWRGRFPIERVAVLIGNAWYSIAPALVFLAFSEPDATPLSGWVILLIALVAQSASDFACSIAREWFALRIPPRQLLGPLAWVVMIDTLLAPIGLLVALAILVTQAAVLLPLPLLGLIWFFAHERTQRLDQTLELSSAYRGTAYLLGDVVGADNEYTGTHSRDVVDLVLGVCDEIGLDQRLGRRAEFAALLHDVGKIKIPAEIINKPASLTPHEWAIMKTHTIEGEQLLQRVGGLLAEVGTIVRSCHEHYDGNGYPDGLAGDAIPLVARIVATCDAYNAITTDRPYRKARSSDEALTEITNHRGTQFDPVTVDALAARIRRANQSPQALAERVTADTAFAPPPAQNAPPGQRFGGPASLSRSRPRPG